MQPGPNKNAPDFVHQNTDILDVQILQQNRAYAAPFVCRLGSNDFDSRQIFDSICDDVIDSNFLGCKIMHIVLR